MTEVTDREIALQTKLAEMLCSKLCHDLISPIGAINNGLEFLQDADSGMADDAAILIGGSAKRAAQKLDYFRLAFGVGGSGDNMDITTVRSKKKYLPSGKAKNSVLLALFPRISAS